MGQKCVVQILDSDNKVAGCGFLITKKHILTCAHVVNFAFKQKVDNPDMPSGELSVNLLGIDAGSPPIKAKSCKGYWYPFSSKQKAVSDIALLEIIGSLPDDYKPGLFASNEHWKGKEFDAHGFPEDAKTEERITKGTITGSLISNSWLQVEAANAIVGHHIQPGFSGAPAMLKDAESIIGMIASYDNIANKREGFIIPGHLLLAALGLSGYHGNSQISTIISMAEFFELKELLADVEIPEHRLHLFFTHFPDSNKPKNWDLLSCLYCLADKPHISSETAPLFEFLDHIHDLIPQTLLLRDWKEKTASRLSIDLNVIQKRVNTLKQHNQLHSDPHLILLIKIEPKNWVSNDQFVLRAWLRQNDEYFTEYFSEQSHARQELENILKAILCEAVRKLGPLSSKLITEIVLPLTLFDWNINHINISPELIAKELPLHLGTRYAIKIRSWDRIYHPDFTLLKSKWDDKWGECASQDIKSHHIHVLDSESACIKNLRAKLENSALVFLPLCELSWHSEHTHKIFAVALTAGIPFIFWMPPQVTVTKTKIKELKRLLRSQVTAQWTASIQEKKAQKAFFNDFIMFSDDPEHLPPDASYTLTMPD